MGTPAKGRGSPGWMPRAAASAPIGSSQVKALRSCRASARARAAEVNSLAEIVPARTIAASSNAERVNNDAVSDAMLSLLAHPVDAHSDGQALFGLAFIR